MSDEVSMDEQVRRRRVFVGTATPNEQRAWLKSRPWCKPSDVEDLMVKHFPEWLQREKSLGVNEANSERHRPIPPRGW